MEKEEEEEEEKETQQLWILEQVLTLQQLLMVKLQFLEGEPQIQGTETREEVPPTHLERLLPLEETQMEDQGETQTEKGDRLQAVEVFIHVLPTRLLLGP